MYISSIINNAEFKACVPISEVFDKFRDAVDFDKPYRDRFYSFRNFDKDFLYVISWIPIATEIKVKKISGASPDGVTFYFEKNGTIYLENEEIAMIIHDLCYEKWVTERRDNK